MENRMKKTMLVAVPLSLALACGGRSDNTADTTTATATTPVAGATTQAAVGGEVQPGQLLDPNSATREQLLSAPGVDSGTAAAIIGGRPYADMVAVDKTLAARNLTPEQRKAIYAMVWRPIDLNTAKGEEILLIPGVGNRMKHEFEEYRPYKAIEQFRREIGKYVNKDEVARLEKYVSVK
jgi:DNA uptake protein ComE-like DNA-binding protein